MSKGALFIAWDRAVIGREAHAAELFAESMNFYNRAVSDNRIESFEPVILAMHGGDMNGFILVRGEEQKLDEFRRSNDFLDMTIRAGYVLEGYGAVPAYIGNSLNDIMSRWTKLVTR